MINATTFNEATAKSVETAVMQEFDCKYSEVIGLADTVYKKVVVFVLSKLYSFNQRQLCRAYSMNFLYVPTVVSEIEDRFMLDVEMRERICRICKSIGYEYAEMGAVGSSVA